MKFFSQKIIDDPELPGVPRSLQFMEPGGENFMKRFNNSKQITEQPSTSSRDVLEDNTNKWITQMFTLLKKTP